MFNSILKSCTYTFFENPDIHEVEVGNVQRNILNRSPYKKGRGKSFSEVVAVKMKKYRKEKIFKIPQDTSSKFKFEEEFFPNKHLDSPALPVLK